MLMISAMMPIEALIAKMKEAISEYDAAILLNKSTDLELKMVRSICMLILTKERVGDSFDKVDELSREIDNLHNLTSVMKPKN